MQLLIRFIEHDEGYKRVEKYTVAKLVERTYHNLNVLRYQNIK